MRYTEAVVDPELVGGGPLVALREKRVQELQAENGNLLSHLAGDRKLQMDTLPKLCTEKKCPLSRNWRLSI